jgi:hypothetical protein
MREEGDAQSHESSEDHNQVITMTWVFLCISPQTSQKLCSGSLANFLGLPSTDLRRLNSSLISCLYSQHHGPQDISHSLQGILPPS